MSLPAPPAAVYVTSPDYLGGMADMANALAEVCRETAARCCAVDNAHGAYLRFLSNHRWHPLDLGADMCCASAHKTLPVLTGGAYLHISSAPAGTLRRSVQSRRLALFGSTSPSYLIMASLDAVQQPIWRVDYPKRIAGDGQGIWTALKRRLTGAVGGKCPNATPFG